MRVVAIRAISRVGYCANYAYDAISVSITFKADRATSLATAVGREAMLMGTIFAPRRLPANLHGVLSGASPQRGAPPSCLALKMAAACTREVADASRPSSVSGAPL